MSRGLFHRTQKPLYDRLIEIDQVFRKASEKLATEQAVALVTIKLLIIDPTTKETKAIPSHLSVQFHGPLCTAWSQRKPVTQSADFQKELKLSRERLIDPMFQLFVRDSSYSNPAGPSFSASSAEYPQWDATEFAFQNVFEADAKWYCSLEFDQETKKLMWVSFAYDPSNTPGATSRLFEDAVETQERRLVALSAAASHVVSE
jgi:hypothetical protein